MTLNKRRAWGKGKNSEWHRSGILRKIRCCIISRSTFEQNFFFAYLEAFFLVSDLHGTTFELLKETMSNRTNCLHRIAMMGTVNSPTSISIQSCNKSSKTSSELSTHFHYWTWRRTTRRFIVSRLTLQLSAWFHWYANCEQTVFLIKDYHYMETPM